MMGHYTTRACNSWFPGESIKGFVLHPPSCGHSDIYELAAGKSYLAHGTMVDINNIQ